MKKMLLTPFIILCLSNAIAQTTVGMLAYFKMDGSITNLGSGNVTGTAIGTSYTTNNTNTPNTAILFAGTTSSYIDFVDNGNLDFSGTANFTISFSFFYNGTANCGMLDNCLNYGGWGVWFWQQSAGIWNIQFNYKNGSVGSPAATAFTKGFWHHVAAVRNNGTISIYIDGAFRLSGAEGTMNPTYPINMIAGAMAFSSYSPPRYNPYGGKLDEIRIYNRALTAAEIIALSGNALPVKLNSFTAVNKNNTVTLKWKTEYEQNSSHYNIQRSIDGSNFTDVERVVAAGNSSLPLTYSYNDLLPASYQSQQTIFYRLQSVDIDGNFAYSQVIALHLDKKEIELFVSPNPAKDILQVQTGKNITGNSSLMIVDASGRVLYKKEMVLQQGSNTVPVNISLLSSGMYIVRLVNGSDSYVKQFIKE